MNENVCGIIVVTVLIVLDYGSGVLNAVLRHELTSEKMRTGLAHKFGYVVVLCLAGVLEFGERRIDLGFEVSLLIPCVVGIALIEVTSILENCVKLNPSLGESKILSVFGRKGDDVKD